MGKPWENHGKTDGFVDAFVASNVPSMDLWGEFRSHFSSNDKSGNMGEKCENSFGKDVNQQPNVGKMIR